MWNLREKELPLWEMAWSPWYIEQLVWHSTKWNSHKRFLHRNRVEMHKFHRSQIIFEIPRQCKIYSFLFFSYSPIWPPKIIVSLRNIFKIRLKLNQVQFGKSQEKYVGAQSSVDLEQEDDLGRFVADFNFWRRLLNLIKLQIQPGLMPWIWAEHCKYELWRR